MNNNNNKNLDKNYAMTLTKKNEFEEEKKVKRIASMYDQSGYVYLR